MKNARVLNVLSLLFNLIIVGAVAYVLAVILPNVLVESLKFFTIISNLLLALTALICIPCNIVGIAKGKRLPAAVYVLKLVGVVAAAITLLVAAVLLPIATNSSVAEQFGNFSFQSERFFLA
ncbi:MAG: hypothetical protein J5803_00440 [Desulfovibrio sp.]|nr:hypothetical protein [Desulfovibrio sp.]